MRRLFWFLLTLWVVLLCAPVMAADITLNCDDPTQNDDGTPLTDLSGVRVYESTTQGGPYTEILDVAGCASIPVITRGPGSYYFVATAYNTAGVESIFSNEAVKVVPPVAPDPPQNLVVDPGNLVAYGISQSADRLVTYPVGTVAADTACDGTMQANGLYLVPREAVSWAGSVEPLVVLASCIAG